MRGRKVSALMLSLLVILALGWGGMALAAVILLLNQIDGSRETVEQGTKYLADNNLTMTNLFDYANLFL